MKSISNAMLITAVCLLAACNHPPSEPSEPSAKQSKAEAVLYLATGSTVATCADIKSAKVLAKRENGLKVINITYSADVQNGLKMLSEANIGRSMAIVLDGRLVSDELPIRSTYNTSEIQISGGGDEFDAFAEKVASGTCPPDKAALQYFVPIGKYVSAGSPESSTEEKDIIFLSLTKEGAEQASVDAASFEAEVWFLFEEQNLVANGAGLKTNNTGVVLISGY